ncbi:hypothetical protein JVU11DRAFT_3518 [Chiua virens]|nr:hypothetical protein JVU11DRAFT_3518 [Chiua virens]
MSELVCKTLDHDATDMLIDKWLEHRNDAYWEWFQGVRERKHASNTLRRQVIVWSKGDFVPENIFCRTVDTGRLIPLDRTWTTHVYHHRSMQDRKLSMMPVVFTMVVITFIISVFTKLIAPRSAARAHALAGHARPQLRRCIYYCHRPKATRDGRRYRVFQTCLSTCIRWSNM